MESHAPNCHKCQYFQVTYDSKAPKGCAKFGFKTRNQPSLEVLATTGKQCVFFSEKAAQAAPEAVTRTTRPHYSSLSILA